MNFLLLLFAIYWNEVILKEEINIISKWYYYNKIKKQEEETRKNLLEIALTILIQDKKTNEISHYQSLDYNKISLIQIKLNLEPGNYIILPRTSDCFLEDQKNQMKKTQYYLNI